MIFIRADGNSEIGSGHIMRCMSIANEFRIRGYECIFVTADHYSDTLIENEYFKKICLDSNWKELDSEIDKFTLVIDAYKPKLVILDHYFVSAKYMDSIRVHSKLVYLDDLNAFSYPVDCVINYGLSAEKIEYNTPISLLGIKYTPLRKEFIGIAKKKIKQNVTDVLISTGGADPMRMSLKFIELVKKYYCSSSVTFHLIIGALNPYLAEIKKEVLYTDNIVLHVNEQHIAKIMENSDIAISAAGSTLLELCACGVPTITYISADNQIIGAEQFEEAGLMCNAGDCRDDISFNKNISDQLDALTGDYNKRVQTSIKMQNLVDGRGAERIVMELVN